MRIKLPARVRKRLFKLIEERPYFKSWTHFSKMIKSTSRWTLQQIRKGKWTFPKNVFKEILTHVEPPDKSFFEKVAIELDDDWATRNRWNSILSKKEKIVEQKNGLKWNCLRARLCGYIAGDGSIFRSRAKNGKWGHHDIEFYPDDFEMAKSFTKAFFLLYGRRINIRWNVAQNYYEVRACDKVAFNDIFHRGKFGTYNWDFPSELVNAKAAKIEWLRALFDSEAHVAADRIQIQSVNKHGLTSVKNVLSELEIETSKIYKYIRKEKEYGINYILEIRRVPNLERYLRVVGFNHSSKQAKLNAIIGEMAEWSKAPVSKTGSARMRGFNSHSLRAPIP